MSNFLIKIGVVLVIFETILTVIGLAKPNWISACIPYNGFDALMKIASFDFEGDDKSSTSPIFNEHKLCIHLGVFQISLQIFLFNLNIFKSFESMRHELQGIISCFFAGNLITIATAVLIVYQMRWAVSALRKKLWILKFCIGLHIFGCVLSGIGIITYTAYRSSLVHNAPRFQLELEDVLIKAIPSNNPPNGEVQPYAVGEDHENSMTNIAVSEPDIDMKNEVFEESAKSVFRNLDPDFGYSFYFIWLKFGIAILSSAAFALGYLYEKKCDTLRPIKPRPESL